MAPPKKQTINIGNLLNISRLLHSKYVISSTEATNLNIFDTIVILDNTHTNYMNF